MKKFLLYLFIGIFFMVLGCVVETFYDENQTQPFSPTAMGSLQLVK